MLNGFSLKPKKDSYMSPPDKWAQNFPPFYQPLPVQVKDFQGGSTDRPESKDTGRNETGTWRSNNVPAIRRIIAEALMH
jgi:hypothetical protein